jgi:hypothetical protein
MKKILISLVIITVLTLSACQQSPQEQPTFVRASKETVMQIDINPSVTFIIDEDDNVVAVIINNDDAEIITADLMLVGETWQVALDRFLSAAHETGYLNVTRGDNQVTIRLSEEGLEDFENFSQAVKQRVQGFLAREDLQGVADIRPPFLDDLKATADSYNVSVSHWVLIQAALNVDDTLTLDAALETPREDLQALLQASYQSRKDAALNAKEELRAIIQAELEAFQDGIEHGEIEPPADFQALRDLLRDRFRRYQESQETP